MSSPYSYDLQGQDRGKVFTSGDDGVVGVRWFQATTDCVISGIASSNLENASVLVGITIPAGVGFGGRMEAISLSSGVAVVYYY
jgi:hypothetical protein